MLQAYILNCTGLCQQSLLSWTILTTNQPPQVDVSIAAASFHHHHPATPSNTYKPTRVVLYYSIMMPYVPVPLCHCHLQALDEIEIEVAPKELEGKSSRLSSSPKKGTATGQPAAGVAGAEGAAPISRRSLAARCAAVVSAAAGGVVHSTQQQLAAAHEKAAGLLRKVRFGKRATGFAGFKGILARVRLGVQQEVLCRSQGGFLLAAGCSSKACGAVCPTHPKSLHVELDWRGAPRGAVNSVNPCTG